MTKFNDFFLTTGMMFCCYCFARIFHSLQLILEDKNSHNFIQKLLVCLLAFFYFFSAPVSIIIYFLQKYPISRRVKFEIEEDRKNRDAYWKSIIKSERRNYRENRPLSYIADVMGSDYTFGYDEGYSAGFDDGYTEASSELLNESAP